MKSNLFAKIKIMPVFIAAVCLTINFSIIAQVQNSYVHQGSIGQKKTVSTTNETSNTIFPFRPISKWTGERFIFLPMPKSLQHFGYQGFGNDLSSFDYDKYVGRIAKVDSVIEQDGNVPKVFFSIEDNGVSVQASAFSESIDGIGPVADIDSARTQWLNKTLWYKETKLHIYDEVKDTIKVLTIKKYSPVKIIDIVAGWYCSSPIRFILQCKTGEEGYVDCNLSNTTVADILREFDHFDKYFMTEDPRLKHHWPLRVWTAIEGGTVYIGMTAEQAKMGWGEPDEINRTIVHTTIHEQWVYKTRSFLYFENGILASIQN